MATYTGRPGLHKAGSQFDRCATCNQRAERTELVRHGGECFSCATERETATLFLSEPETQI